MRKKVISLSIIFLFVLSVASCETMSQKDKTTLGGAGAGAAIGTLAGLAFGQGAKAAIAGGLIGTLGGGLIGRYAFGKHEEQDKAASDYNYQPSVGTLLEIERVEIHPARIRPGEQVNILVQYAFLAPKPDQETDITEIREVYYKGRLVGNPKITVPRSGGTYASKVPITLPANAILGTYDVKITIQTPSKSDSSRTSFVVM